MGAREKQGNPGCRAERALQGKTVSEDHQAETDHQAPQDSPGFQAELGLRVPREIADSQALQEMWGMDYCLSKGNGAYLVDRELPAVQANQVRLDFLVNPDCPGMLGKHNRDPPASPGRGAPRGTPGPPGWGSQGPAGGPGPRDLKAPWANLETLALATAALRAGPVTLASRGGRASRGSEVTRATRV